LDKQLLGASREPINLSFDAESQSGIPSRQRSARILEEEIDRHVPIVVCRDPLLCTFQTVRCSFAISGQKVCVTKICERSRNLGLVLISHDLNVVDAISDRVMVMYQGRIVEAGPTRRVLGNPASDYTRSLLAAKLVADPHIARTRRQTMDDALASAPISGSNLQGAPQ